MAEQPSPSKPVAPPETEPSLREDLDILGATVEGACSMMREDPSPLSLIIADGLRASYNRLRRSLDTLDLL